MRGAGRDEHPLVVMEQVADNFPVNMRNVREVGKHVGLRVCAAAAHRHSLADSRAGTVRDGRENEGNSD